MQKKTKFELIEENNSKSQQHSPKKLNQISTVSIYETDICRADANSTINSHNAKNLALMTSSITSLNKLNHTNATNKHNSIKSTRTVMIKTNVTNLRDNNNPSDTHNNKRPPLPQMPPIFQMNNHQYHPQQIAKQTVITLDDQRFGNETSTESELLNNSAQNSQCFIYGISNKAFTDDLHHNATSSEKHSCFNSQENSNFVPSSFRPMPSHGSTTNVNKIEIKSDESRPRSVEIASIHAKSPSESLKDDPVTYQHPWKLCTNDYEALEATHTHTNTNTGTSGSLGNLSAVTAYSEVFSESKMLDCVDNKVGCVNTHRNLICSNNNELISRSSKITQELELRLKERRQMMESKSDKFHPKILHQSDLTQSLNLPHTDGRHSSNSAHSGGSSSSSRDLDPLCIIQKLNSNSFGAGSASNQNWVMQIIKLIS